MKKPNIHLIQPKSFRIVTDGLIIKGWVTRKFLETSFNTIDDRIHLDMLDIEGCTQEGTTIYIKPQSLLARISRRFYFYFKVGFNYQASTDSYLRKSQGRIAIRLSGSGEENLIVPIVVKGYQSLDKIDPQVEEKHNALIDKISVLEKDWKNYRAELEKISERHFSIREVP